MNSMIINWIEIISISLNQMCVLHEIPKAMLPKFVEINQPEY